MRREIRTRKVQRNIRTLNKSAIIAEHLKNAYVRTKDSKKQTQQGKGNEHAESQYAESKITGVAGLAARQSIRQAGKTVSCLSAGMEKEAVRGQVYRKEQERTSQKSREQERISRGQAGWQEKAGQRTETGSARRAGSLADQDGKNAGRKDIKSAMKPAKAIKTSGQADKRAAGAMRTAQEAAKKRYVESKVSGEMAEKMLASTSRTAGMAERAVKANIKAGASAVRAMAASAKAMVSAAVAGGGVTVFLLIFIILFGGFLYTVGGSNSSAVSQVSKEVEGYEPLIRKYASQYGIEEYVELLKAVMMQESGGRGLDPMQSSEGAFNTRYPRQPNGIKDPEYSISCGVQELKAALTKAEVKNPLDMERIKLALQGYNFGSGYISWAKRKYGGYSAANAAEFSDMMAKRMGWSRYGDKEYVPHVLRYYAFGRIPTGIGNKAIVQVALSQEGNKGGRPYWSWYGYGGRVSWCACFVSWCADQCGYIDSGQIPKFSSCANGASWFRSRGRLKDRSYVPSPGDIIFFDWGAGVHHVGIVVDVSNGRVNTIEGNSGDAVRRRSYKIGDGRIHGYGVYAF